MNHRDKTRDNAAELQWRAQVEHEHGARCAFEATRRIARDLNVGTSWDALQARIPRTSRDVCRDAVVLDYYPRRQRSLGHKVATLVCTAIGVVLVAALLLGRAS